MLKSNLCQEREQLYAMHAVPSNVYYIFMGQACLFSTIGVWHGILRTYFETVQINIKRKKRKRSNIKWYFPFIGNKLISIQRNHWKYTN